MTPQLFPAEDLTLIFGGLLSQFSGFGAMSVVPHSVDNGNKKRKVAELSEGVIEIFKEATGFSADVIEKFMKTYPTLFNDPKTSAENMKYVCTESGFTLAEDYRIFFESSVMSRTLKTKERYVHESKALCNAVGASTTEAKKKIFRYCAGHIFEGIVTQTLKDLHGLGLDVPKLVNSASITFIHRHGHRVVDRARAILDINVLGKRFTTKQVGTMIAVNGTPGFHTSMMTIGFVSVLKDELATTSIRDLWSLANRNQLVQKVNAWV
jgi:hypothetical protein